MRDDEIANCVTATQTIEQHIVEFIINGEESVTITNKTQFDVDITKPFTYVSLFSGIGGFETALNRLGGKCVMASEIDKHANKAYEILYGMPTTGDVTKIAVEDVPDHDLLTAGFPCQSFSIAGKRLGFEDTRGTLFFEIARIAKEKRPKVLLLENVKGLIGHNKGNTIETIVRVLNDIGYTVDFQVLNSKYFGVPQNRERVFFVCVRDDLIDREPWRIEGTNVVAKAKKRLSQIDGIKTFNFDWPEQTEVTTRLRDILEDNVDEKYYLSEEKTAKLVAQLESHQEIDSDGLQMLGKIEGINGHEQRKKVYSVNGVSPTPSGLGIGGNTEPKIAEEQIYSWEDEFRIRREEQEVRPVLTPDRIEKRQNGRRFKDSDEPAFTLTAQDRHGVAMGKKPRYRIRKLTPLECFRLQGFPDEYYFKLKQAGISNSQLYKMAGNAVTVNVVQVVTKTIKEQFLCI